MNGKTTIKTSTTTRRGFYQLTQDTTMLAHRGEYHDEYGYPQIKVPAGEKVRILIQEYTDGRTYYTVYKRTNGLVYSRTTMVKDGEVHPGVGEGFVHEIYE